MTRPDLEALREATVVAVLRAPDAEAALATVDTLVEGGVTGIEVTYGTPTPLPSSSGSTSGTATRSSSAPERSSRSGRPSRRCRLVPGSW